MSSNERPTFIELLERGTPTTPEDIEALRRRPSPPMSPEEYLRFLSQFKYSQASLRARRGPQGERFVLPPVDGARK